MYVNLQKAFLSENPYYFYREKSEKSPKCSGKKFSFFKKNSPKESSTGSLKSPLPQTTNINSATLYTDVSILGSPRGSFGSYFSSVYAENAPRPPKYTRKRLESFHESIREEKDTIPERIKTLPRSYKETRRYSDGTYSRRGEFLPLSDEVPNMMAPKRPLPFAKYEENLQQNDNSGCSNMDDILILTGKHSERALLWANFLKNRFDKITKQRGRKPFNFLHVKIDDGHFLENAEKYQTTALQIVIICPIVLSFSASNLMHQLSAILNPDKVLGVLLDIHEDKILDVHKVLPSLQKWRLCAVRGIDLSFTGNIVGIATDILGKALSHRPRYQKSNTIHHTKSRKGEMFTVFPRKVKMGQNKLIALLNEPIMDDDRIKITIEKCGDFIEVKNFKKRNPYTLQFNIPESCMEISTMVDIHIQKNDVDYGSRPVKCESRLRELEQLIVQLHNPVEFMCHSLGVGIKERDSLDVFLLKNFQKNIPPHFDLFATSIEKQKYSTLKESNSEEYPTLLHFAAKWGLERLSMQLLECPGGYAACEIKNCLGRTPSVIAELEGFEDLAKSLKSFTKMHEFATMYDYFKEITTDTDNNINVGFEPKMYNIQKDKFQQNKIEPENTENEQALYMEMNTENECENSIPILAVSNLNYSNLESDELPLHTIPRLCQKPAINNMNAGSNALLSELRINEPSCCNSTESISGDEFSKQCSNLLENCCTTSQTDYLIQPSNIPVHCAVGTNSKNQALSHSKDVVDYQNVSPFSEKCEKNGKVEYSNDTFNFTRKNTRNEDVIRNDTSKGNADDELAEIMYDFKNNVLTIREVEQLVEKWRNRNDVKQSFKEKREQIERLREEYEKIQERMKTTTKNPTPFDRVKKLFCRSKPTMKLNTHDNDDVRSSESSNGTSQRPLSILSLQSVCSTSSSGKMSSISECSGASHCDSGTHSDHEDRRKVLAQTYNMGLARNSMDNYMIPPTPRPVSSSSSTPTPIEEKGNQVFTYNSNINSPNITEHYILFPSNIPVFPNINETQCNNHNTPKFSIFNTNNKTEAKGEKNVDCTVEVSKDIRENKIDCNEAKGSIKERKNSFKNNIVEENIKKSEDMKKDNTIPPNAEDNGS